MLDTEYMSTINELCGDIEDRELLDRLALTVYAVGIQIDMDCELCLDEDGLYTKVYIDM